MSFSLCLFHLMSWSMLHNGDMSSNVFENFTTYKRDNYHHNWQQQHSATKMSEFCTRNAICGFHGKVQANESVRQEQVKKLIKCQRSHRWVDVFKEKHRAAFTLQQGQRSLHDLPNNLLQVSLFLKQVVDHLQQSLWPQERTLMTYVQGEVFC